MNKINVLTLVIFTITQVDTWLKGALKKTEKKY